MGLSLANLKTFHFLAKIEKNARGKPYIFIQIWPKIDFSPNNTKMILEVRGASDSIPKSHILPILAKNHKTLKLEYGHFHGFHPRFLTKIPL